MSINALVVDDSAIMRRMVMRSLARANLGHFAFEEADDGAKALDKLRAGQFDIVFLDWNMPNMTGIELVRQIRASDEKTVPIVMITTEATQESPYLIQIK